MTDLANLGLAVDSSQVASASKELKNLAAASQAAEQGATKVEKAFERTSQTAQKLELAFKKGALSAQTLNQHFTGGAGDNTASRAADIEAYAASLDALRAKFNPLFAVEQKHKEQLKAIADAQKVGAISQTEATAAVAMANASYAHQSQVLRVNERELLKTGKTAALSAASMTNLGYQINDVATQAALGQDPLRILAAQGGQFYQILSQGQGGVRGSLSYVLGLLRNMITPFRVLVGLAGGLSIALVSAAVGWRSAQREIALGLTGMGSAAGVTVENINDISFAAANTGKVTVGAARDIALAFASTGRVTAEIIGQITQLTPALAKIYGEDTAATADRLSKAFADPAKGVEELNKRLAVFDAATVQHIRSLTTQGNRYEAQKRLIDGIAQSTKAATEQTSGWEHAWDRLAASFSKYWAIAGRAVDRATGGGTVDDQLAAAQRRLEMLRNNSGRRGIPVDPKEVAEATAEVERLRQKVHDVWAEAAERGNVVKSLDLSKAIREIAPYVGQLREATDAYEGLRNKLADPAAVKGLPKEDLAESARAVLLAEEAMRSAEMKLQYQKSSLDVAKEDASFALQAVQARTVGQQAELAYRQTLARLQREGDVNAEVKALAERNRVLAEGARQVADQIRQRNFASAQAIELAQLELSLIGKTADEAERIKAAFEARQQVQAQAFQSFRTASDTEIKQAETAARAKADIESKIRRERLLEDLRFEREQITRTDSEASLYSRMQSAGLLENGRIVGAQNEAIAAQMRLNDQLQRSIDIQKEFASTFLRDIMAGKSATEALGSALENLAQRMLDNSLNLLFSGLGQAGGVSTGGLFGGNILPGVFHAGGIAGNDNAPRRSVPAAAFAGAPRYHTGGIAGLRPDEVPAILQKGERIIPKGGGSGTGQDITVHVSLDSDMLRAVVVDESGRQIAESSGALKAEMKRQGIAAVRTARDRRLA